MWISFSSRDRLFFVYLEVFPDLVVVFAWAGSIGHGLGTTVED